MEENRAQKGPQEWFLDAHPERGTLRVQVSTGRGLFPVEGARVEVYRDFGDQRNHLLRPQRAVEPERQRRAVLDRAVECLHSLPRKRPPAAVTH